MATTVIPILGADGMSREWRMIELQGTMAATGESNPSSLQGLDIGELEFDNGVPVLCIGNHRLEGKTMEIKKPFAVMEKQDDDGVEYKVLGVVKNKIIFKTRPKPIVKKRKVEDE